MIKSYYDSECNAVVIEFEGKIDAEQVRQFQPEIAKLIPSGAGFRLLTDFTLLEEMELDGLDIIKQNMDLLNQRGVTEIIRVSPNPEHDFGFNILSIFHYSKNVRWVVLKSRAEANERLKKAAQA